MSRSENLVLGKIIKIDHITLALVFSIVFLFSKNLPIVVVCDVCPSVCTTEYLFIFVFFCVSWGGGGGGQGQS